MSTNQDVVGVQVRTINGYDLFVTPRLCPHMSFDGKCDLHGKKTQPNVCSYFPMAPTDKVYQAVKHICGYKFKKKKNPNYKTK